MEREINNCSTFSVPGAMSDVTLLSTPLPQAASTAQKRRTTMEDEDHVMNSTEQFQRELAAFRRMSSSLSTTGQIQDLIQMGEYRANVDAAQSKKADSQLRDYYRQLIPGTPLPMYSYPSHSEPVHKVRTVTSSMETNPQIKLNAETQNKKSPRGSDAHANIISTAPLSNTSKRGSNSLNVFKDRNTLTNPDVGAVKIASAPFPNKNESEKNIGNKLNLDIQTSKLSTKPDTDIFKIPAVPSTKTNHEKINKLDTSSQNLAFPGALTKYKSTRNVSNEDDRTSVASSANSSLGVIPAEFIEDAFKEPLVDVNKDLSLRLAQKLNLDTSLLKDGMDISALASERYKEKVAAKYENKENKRYSGRSSSDHWTIHGYSSDNSDSRNNTAKRMSSLSSGSGGEAEISRKSSSSRRSLRPLSEINSIASTSTSKSRSGRYSMGSNPFGSYSNISVSSEDFQSGEDAMKRLDRDERQFSIGSSRSLSGIYGDANISVNVDGEKLSMSSFLRSGSYPLGSLETGYTDAQSPQFGLPSKSPEKREKPKPILPPPNEKSTFIIDEEPVRDTPWAPSSLLEQYSNIHNTNTDTTDPDISVPSLSYIGELLDKMQHGADPKEMLAQLMDCKNKTKSKADNSVRTNTISSFVEGDNSFCRGIESEHNFSTRNKSGLHHSAAAASLDESFCNITDFEGDEEAYVCVLTPQSMDFDIFNELSHPVEYSFAKVCYADGQRNDSAAYVHFPVSKLMLFPGQERTLTIKIAALRGGVIKVKIEVVRRNPLTQARECSYVYGKIMAELPKVHLVTQQESEMVPTSNCDLYGKYQHTVTVQNEGRSAVPLKLTLIKLEDDDVEFYFDKTKKETVTVMVEPGQMLNQLVLCQTPPIFAHCEPSDTVIPVKARVEFHLATTELHKLSPIDPVTLIAPLKPYFFGAPPSLVVPSNFSLYNSCDQPVVFRANTVFGYVVHPSTFTIPSLRSFIVTVNTDEMKNPQRCGELTLRGFYPIGQDCYYKVQLNEEHRSSLSSNNSLATPHSSRATSPTSPSCITRAPVRDLQLGCSHNQLVWGGCHLHQRVVKSFCLKNNGNQREKLRLTTSDTCFKIVGEDDALKQELKLSLQPMADREIKVAVLATVAGPQWGKLTISRISRATDKKVLPLYAVGGKPKVSLAEGVFEVEKNKYLFLDERTLKGFITLSNTGDNSAFLKISANSKSSAGLSISPQESVLAANHTVCIGVTLAVTAERLEYLLRQSNPSVCVAQLSIHWGDESTRQRLLRMRRLHGVLAAGVSQFSRISSAPITNLDKLDCSEEGAERLWEEDIDEWTIGVFVKRTALEAMSLDTPGDFVDLSTTVSTQFQG